MQNRQSFTEVTKVTKTYNKQGKLVESVVSKQVVSTSSNRARRTKAEALDRLKTKIDKLEISPAFGNMLAKIVKNVKDNPRQKVRKPRQYIETSGAELRFKSSIQTDLNALRLIRDMIVAPDEWGLDEERVKKLYKILNNNCYIFMVQHPWEALMNKYIRETALRWQRSKQVWYERLTGEYPCPLSKKELEEFLQTKIKEAEASKIECMK